MNDYVVEMLGIEKSYNQNKVLHGVDFHLRAGSVHALLGENGTGKTTLMNILGGVICPDAGEIRIDQAPVNMLNTRCAEDCRIAFIHQELTLINDLSVYENLFLGKELTKHGILDRKTMIQRAESILTDMGIELSPTAAVGELNASYKQIVEIARSLMRNARIIIMDEPTASLTDIEIQHTFSLMRALQKQGVSFVFITHKLNEVMEIADHFTVMRDGLVVASGEIGKSICEATLARHMVGKTLNYDDVFQAREIGNPILEVRNLNRHKEFLDINFTVKKGEIVGFTGLLGDGRSELFATLYGTNQPNGGEIYIDGKLTRIRSTSHAKSLGISYVPRNRKENGIIKDMSISENMSISIIERLKRVIFISRRKEASSNQEYVKRLRIRASELSHLITSLSGGNQQKVVLAKALGPNPALIILDNPTQGVDVGAKLEIYNIIMELARQGVSFVILSSEAPEILMLSDRIYVMYQGAIRKELTRCEANEETIMILATGGAQLCH